MSMPRFPLFDPNAFRKVRSTSSTSLSHHLMLLGAENRDPNAMASTSTPLYSFSASFHSTINHSDVAVPDFDAAIAQHNFQFEELTAMTFDDGRLHADKHNLKKVYWYESARANVFAMTKFTELLTHEAQADSVASRFVLGVDMVPIFASEGSPDKIIPSHAQMSHHNAVCITAGIVFRRIEDGVFIIEGGSNETSRFESSLQKWQLFAIAVMESEAYQQGKIRFDSEPLRFVDVDSASRKEYRNDANEFIKRMETLRKIYQETLLTAEQRAEYAKNIVPVTLDEVQRNETLNEYKTRMGIPFYRPQHDLSMPNPSVQSSLSRQWDLLLFPTVTPSQPFSPHKRTKATSNLQATSNSDEPKTTKEQEITISPPRIRRKPGGA